MCVARCPNLPVDSHSPSIHHRCCDETQHGHQVRECFVFYFACPTHICSTCFFFFFFNRKSMEVRDKKNQESADWLRAYNMRSQAMKRSITSHVKPLDLEEVLKEKLQHHRSVLVSKAVHLTVSQPLNVTSQQPHCCHRSSNCNLLVHQGSLTSKK